MAQKKKKAGKKNVIVAVSGGFDPIHAGHIRMFERAKALGDYLVVILNNDNWLEEKKHHIFMRDTERKEVIESVRAVDAVVMSGHKPHPKDMSVSADLRKLHPDIFANGGDRDEKNAADPTSSLYHDINTCKELGIKMIFNIGDGGKIQSSSWLLKDYVAKVSGMKKATSKKSSSKKRG